MKRKLCAVVLLVMVAVPSLTFGQAMSGTVGLLGFGPGWYSGATRVIQATVTRAGITEVANIALTTTMRGLLGSAVIAAMVIAEPAFNSGVDAIRTWIATAGISRYNGGIGKASVWTGGPKVFVNGSADASSLAVIQGRHGAPYSTWKIYNSYSDAGTAENSWYSGVGGYSYARESAGDSAGNVSCGFGYLIDFNTWAVIPGSGIAFCGPNTTGEQVIDHPPPPPVAGTVNDITSKLNTDLAANNAAAAAAADEAEDILNKGMPGAAVGNPAATPAVTDQTAAPPATGVVVSMPLPQPMPDGTTTPAGEAAKIVADNLPAGGAITSTPPAAGTSAATPQDKPYMDPAFSGSAVTVPWATPNNFATRWTTFETSVTSSGLFALWGGAFGSVPSGGSSTYTFNAGVFGNHTYDFSSWGSTVFGVLSAVVQIACGFIAVKIATLGRGRTWKTKTGAKPAAGASGADGQGEKARGASVPGSVTASARTILLSVRSG